MLLDEIHSKFKSLADVNITINENKWWNSVPAVPGWYFIKANTPIEIFKQLSTPLAGSKWYNIPDRVRFNEFLLNKGVVIAPVNENSSYVVYTW